MFLCNTTCLIKLCLSLSLSSLHCSLWCPRCLWYSMYRYPLHLWHSFPLFSWMYSGDPWDLSPIFDGPHYTLHSNGSLVVHDANREVDGLYFCSASNGFGSDISKLIRLTVHGKNLLEKISPSFLWYCFIFQNHKNRRRSDKDHLERKKI